MDDALSGYPPAAARPVSGPPPTRPIVLVGLMGAGKTTIGRKLAARLGVPFRDADIEIEQAAGRSIAEMFALWGEFEFREGERRVIARLLQAGPIVLATGGGAFMDPRTRAAIRAQALVGMAALPARNPGATGQRPQPPAVAGRAAMRARSSRG